MATAVETKIMLALPEVAYFVEKIPVGVLVIKPTPLYLRFFQHAKESGMSLKEQCRFLDIPWHARIIPKELVRLNLLKVAREISDDAFLQTMPRTKKENVQWAGVVKEALEDYHFADRPFTWVLHHAGRGLTSEKLAQAAPYLTEISDIAMKTSVETVLERAAKLLAKKAEAQRRARERTRVAGGPLSSAVWVGVDYARTMEDIFIQHDRMIHDAFSVHPSMLIASTGRPTVTLPSMISRDIESIDYPSQLHSVQALGYMVRLMKTRQDFIALGEKLNNCISDHPGIRGGRDPKEIIDFFSQCYKGQRYLVEISRDSRIVAAASFDKEFTMISIKGPNNAEINQDNSIWAAAVAYQSHARGELKIAKTDIIVKPVPGVIGTLNVRLDAGRNRARETMFNLIPPQMMRFREDRAEEIAGEIASGIDRLLAPPHDEPTTESAPEPVEVSSEDASQIGLRDTYRDIYEWLKGKLRG